VRQTLEERFWSKVDIAGPDDCWEWNASRKPEGYGQFTISEGGSRRNANAHRLAWELTNGPIPTGKHVLHRCDNRPCCNPAHLFLGTQADNNADMMRKGRFVHWTATGTKHAKFRLTQEDVAEIRACAASGVGMQELADRFGVVKNHIRGIVRDLYWKAAA
jgi:hypothetical protein